MNVALREDAAADRDAGAVNGMWIVRHERVPPLERFALGDAPVGAACRQPAELTDIVRRERNAIGDLEAAIGVARAAAALDVE